MPHTLRCATVGDRVGEPAERTAPSSSSSRWPPLWPSLWPSLWATVLAVVLLGGALGPGYVLTYDMVWVPDLGLTRDVLGLGSALPRAIPSDAVVAVLDEIAGGALLQKVVLIGTLVGAGAGFGALVRDRSTAARLVAVTLGVWNPFVVERLLLGHWPLLIGYAVLPWLVVTLRDVATRPDRGLPLGVPVLLLLGSLSASAGLASAVVALSLGARAGRRRGVELLMWVVAANLPWIVAGLTSPAASVSDSTGALVFATGDEGSLPGPLAALSFGGVWNLEVVPGSRLGLAGVVMTLLLVAAAVVGAVLVARGAQVSGLGPMVVCWCVGWGLAALSWAAPEVLGWLAAHLPAGGLVRDGSRLLGLTAPLVVVLVAVAVDHLSERLPDPATTGVVGVVLALLPLSLMPDAAWGVGGRLTAVAYPSTYEWVRREVNGAPRGDALSLPFESYRAPDWNDGRRVLDPLGRYLGRPTVVNDELVVDGRRLPGEDPRSRAVSTALEASTPEARASALRAVGVSVVVVEQIDGYPVPEVAGRQVSRGGFSVITLGEAADRAVPAARRAAVLASGGVWLALLVVPLGRLAGRRMRKVTRQ
jgi:hypothetical protein